MKYEVLGYETKEDYEKRKYVVIDEYCSSKKKALKTGNDSLAKYEIVKVQSEDREWIEILEKGKKESSIKEDIQNWLKSK